LYSSFFYQQVNVEMKLKENEVVFVIVEAVLAEVVVEQEEVQVVVVE
jgi:hypothetical protein